MVPLYSELPDRGRGPSILRHVDCAHSDDLAGRKRCQGDYKEAALEP